MPLYASAKVDILIGCQGFNNRKRRLRYPRCWTTYAVPTSPLPIEPCIHVSALDGRNPATLSTRLEV
jgi:hypothetical protein